MAMSESKKVKHYLSIFFAILLSCLIIIYTIQVVSGELPKDNRIDIVHLTLISLVLIGITLLLKPEILERLKLLQIANFKLEMLERVREKQIRQEQQLEDISLIIPLLLPKTERKHLFNLDQGKTDYEGNGSLRAELRRLRSIGLIEMVNNKNVGDMKTHLKFNLANFVKLTDLGERWVRRLKEIEKTDQQS